MKGDAQKMVVRTFAAEGAEFTVRGSRYDLVKMSPPDGYTGDGDNPFNSAKEIAQRFGDDPHTEIIDRRDLEDDEAKAAAWDESGWPEQADTYE